MRSQLSGGLPQCCRRPAPRGTTVRPSPAAARSRAEASSVEAGAATYRAWRPPMASAGPAAATLIHDHLPGAAIVFHDAEESETALFDAIDAGAIAYLTKSATADQLLEAIRRASLGEVLIPVSLFARAIARQRTALADAKAT